MTLAQIMKQDDIYIESAELELRNTLNLMEIEACETGVFLESETNKEGILTKIKKFFEKLIQKVKDFFTSKSVKKKTEDAEKALQKDPKLKKKKVKIKDTRKLEELDKKTLEKLNNKNADPEKIITNYKKQRNILLASLPVITVSAGAILLYIKKISNKTIKSLQYQYNDAQKIISSQNQAIQIRDNIININNDVMSTLRKELKTAKDEMSNRLQREKEKKEAWRAQARYLNNENKRLNKNLNQKATDALNGRLREHDRGHEQIKFAQNANQQYIENLKGYKERLQKIFQYKQEVNKNNIRELFKSTMQMLNTLNKEITNDISNTNDVSSHLNKEDESYTKQYNEYINDRNKQRTYTKNLEDPKTSL